MWGNVQDLKVERNYANITDYTRNTAEVCRQQSELFDFTLGLIGSVRQYKTSSSLTFFLNSLKKSDKAKFMTIT